MLEHSQNLTESDRAIEVAFMVENNGVEDTEEFYQQIADRCGNSRWLNCLHLMLHS